MMLCLFCVVLGWGDCGTCLLVMYTNDVPCWKNEKKKHTETEDFP